MKTFVKCECGGRNCVGGGHERGVGERFKKRGKEREKEKGERWRFVQNILNKYLKTEMEATMQINREECFRQREHVM